MKMLETRLEVFTSKKDSKTYYVINTYYVADGDECKVCSYFLTDRDRMLMRDLLKNIKAEN